jgi:hypothetical protein
MRAVVRQFKNFQSFKQAHMVTGNADDLNPAERGFAPSKLGIGAVMGFLFFGFKENDAAWLELRLIALAPYMNSLGFYHSASGSGRWLQRLISNEENAGRMREDV